MKKYLAALLAVITPTLFINCSPAFNALDMSSTALEQDMMNVRLDESLVTASQTYLGMSELTGVMPNQTVINEYENTAKTSLSESQKVAAITAPIMMTTANLASRFCEIVIANEKALPAAQRRFFSSVDFGAGLASLSDVSLDSVTNQISSKMWGRSPSGIELEAFRQFKADYFAAIAANAKTQPVQTERFALSLCTAGLATYESMSL